jgi:hypothetical protein
MSILSMDVFMSTKETEEREKHLLSLCKICEIKKFVES